MLKVGITRPTADCAVMLVTILKDHVKQATDLLLSGLISMHDIDCFDGEPTKHTFEIKYVNPETLNREIHMLSASGIAFDCIYQEHNGKRMTKQVRFDDQGKKITIATVSNCESGEIEDHPFTVDLEWNNQFGNGQLFKSKEKAAILDACGVLGIEVKTGEYGDVITTEADWQQIHNLTPSLRALNVKI